MKRIEISQCLLWFLILTVMSLHPLQAQTEFEEELLESLSEEQSAELLEELQELRENPVNINRAETDDFRKIPFITQVFIQNIIRQREEKGSFSSLKDFRKRLQITGETWSKIKPYLRIKKRRLNNVSLNFRSRFQRNFSTLKNYHDQYPGSAWKMYQRIKVSQENIFKSALLIEKDTGETDPADHMVGFIELSNVYKEIRLLLGNYYIKSGQGLVTWSPYGFSKGVPQVSSVKKRSAGIRGYKSTDENNFLTGAAADVDLGAFHFLLFASGTRLDASINEDGTVKGFPTSGYHRTEYEKKNKERVTEGLRGIQATLTTKYGEVGASYLATRYSHPVKRNSGEKNLFSFTGHRNFLVGLDFDLCFNRFNVFGEIAGCSTKSIALITGCIYDIDLIKGVVTYRNFSPRFYSPHGQGFGSSSVKNERGINVGLAAKIKKYKINIMFDFYHKPWRTYFTPVPVSGDDLYIWINRNISSHVKVKCKFKFRRKEDYDTYTLRESISSGILKTQRQTSLRLDVMIQFQKVKTKTRIEFNDVSDIGIEEEWGYNSTDETGYLFFQDIDLDCFGPLNIRFRWIQFKTDSYISRVYEFENDLPGTFSIPFLYGKGFRWYMIGRLNIKKHISFNVKYRKTRIKKSAGYGNSICWERKRYVGLQVDVRF
ncbi:MAG: helix-hairpin-helix domain-containing protein [bacterium]